MNVFGKRERSWRKAHKRGVSPIIATILLVAITVVLAAVLYVLISGLTKGPGSTPIGSAFGFGTAQQSSGGTSNPCGAAPPSGHCYSVGIASASSSVTTANVKFTVQSGGSPVSMPGGATVTIVSLTGATLAAFNFTLGTWSGSSLPVTFASTDTLILYASISVSGDDLIAAGTGALQGTTSVSLP